jgi:hypothetical protein
MGCIQHEGRDNMRISLLFILIILCSCVYAEEYNNSEYLLSLSQAESVSESSSSTFVLSSTSGQSYIGDLSSEHYTLSGGILPSNNYISPSAEGSSSSTAGGGKGCAKGFYKNDKGECIILPANKTIFVPAVSPKITLKSAFNFIFDLGKTIYPPNPQLGWVFIIFGCLVLWFANDYIISYFKEKRDAQSHVYHKQDKSPEV